jgi:ABC-type branched-subunit amino acid transport system substrate-binding protein
MDSERNPARVREFIRSGKLDNMDLIIGPVYPRELEVAAPFAQSRQIPLVSPLSGFQAILEDNPFTYQVNSTGERQMELFLEFIGLNTDKELFIIKSTQGQNSAEISQLADRIGKELQLNDPGRPHPTRVLSFDVISRILTDQQNKRTTFEEQLSRSKSNLIFIPSEDEVFVSELVNQLNQRSGRYDLSVVGLPAWAGFNAIDINALFNIELATYSDFFHPFVDYTNLEVLEFCRKYRQNWNSEPTQYSFQGFDVTWYFLRVLFHFGRNFNATLPCWDRHLGFSSFQTPMSFTGKRAGSGFENNALPILRYSKDGLRKEQIHIFTGRQ